MKASRPNSQRAARFKSPDFARHPTEAWAVANQEVEIGPIEKTGNATVDELNQLVMDAFNLADLRQCPPTSS